MTPERTLAVLIVATLVLSVGYESTRVRTRRPGEGDTVASLPVACGK